MGSPATLIDRFFHHATEQTSGRDPDQLSAAVASIAELAEQRTAGTAAVRVLNPSLETDAWSGRHTVVQVVTDDMPFLVDSVLGEIARHGLHVHLLAHPQLVVDETTGEVLDVRPRQAKPGQRIESWMFVEVDRLPQEDDRDDLCRGLAGVLADVRRACADWSAMRQRARSIIADLQLAAPSTVDPETVAPTIDFLSWLDDNHFTFLGYRSYDLLEEPDASYLRSVPGSGLGILRDDPDSAPSLSPLRPEAVATAREPRLLTVTKANTRATVHRTVPLDYLGIRRFDADGTVVGEQRFLGLFTQSAYNESTERLPIVGAKVRAILAASGFAPDSHSGKDLVSVLEGLPRDELFQAPVDYLQTTANDVLRLLERPSAHAYVRKDEFGRFVSVLVFLPRDRYNSASRMRVQHLLEEKFDGTLADHATRIGDGPLAQLHFVLRLPKDSAGPSVDLVALQTQIATATRTWHDGLADAVIAGVGDEAEAGDLVAAYGDAFPEAYKEDFDGESAYFDLTRLVALQSVSACARPHLHSESVDSACERRMKIYRVEEMSLTDVLPVFSDFGLEVTVQRPYELDPGANGTPSYIYDFGLRAPSAQIWTGAGERSEEEVAAAFEDAFAAVWSGAAESDTLNSLVLTAGLDWRRVVILRALARYSRQIASPGLHHIEEALVANPAIAHQLVEHFTVRFDPDLHLSAQDRQTSADELAAMLEAGLDEVASLDQDRILRSLVALVKAAVRTNFYQQDESGSPKPYVSIKLLPQELPMLPEPRPAFEIWVYAPRVEGAHLRFGAVARGGLRWSDRREDFRTEVLGLVKAQTVKNAVIVPTGSKGAFFAKQLPPSSDREAWLAEGRAAYTTFIEGLLDITDNRTVDGVAAPERVIRYDGDDTYLVVAADKGTAKFSDLANSIAQSYGFWLDDAFASGGSAGYDHKEMGITARGAWESVKRHFRELGLDTQAQDFTVVGVGDMSGDVFGNGMLRSEHIRLVAAFDHRHIFLDPDPDAASSFRERERMFALPRSSWEDYDKSQLSAGGGIYARTLKAVPVSDQVRERLGLEEGITSLPPNDLLKAILRAPVDLLWNGGIGTYVKGSEETNAEIGDRGNDPIRVDGSELRTRVVGEGGNLGMSQLGRVEAALTGVQVNTDAIDNSAGVDSSDHEVNIKIALTPLVKDGSMTLEDRNALLHSMTEEVAEKVLRHNYDQNVLLGNGRTQREMMAPVHRRLIDYLEQTAGLDPQLEFLPDAAEWERRDEEGLGMTSPEFAVLIAYSKLGIKEALNSTEFAEDPALTQTLLDYFPGPLRERAHDQLLAHPLRKEIIVNEVANAMVNRGGVSFAFRAAEETGATLMQIARAFHVVRSVFDLPTFVEAVEELDNVVDTAIQAEMLLEFRRLIDRAERWFLSNRSLSSGMDREIERFASPVQTLVPQLGQLLQGSERECWKNRVDWATERGVPEDLADRYASLLDSFSLLDVVETAMHLERDVEEVAEVYFAVSEAFSLDKMLTHVSELPRDDRWSSLARGAMRDDLYGVMRGLTRTVAERTTPGSDAVPRVREWMEENRAALDRTASVLGTINELDEPGLAPLSVALRTLRGLVRQGAAD